MLQTNVYNATPSGIPVPSPVHSEKSMRTDEFCHHLIILLLVKNNLYFVNAESKNYLLQPF